MNYLSHSSVRHQVRCSLPIFKFLAIVLWVSWLSSSAKAAQETSALQQMRQKMQYIANGHYYAIWMAVQIANMDSRNHLDERVLSFYTELPDQLKSTTAFYAGWPLIEAPANLLTFDFVFPRFDRIQRNLHSLSGGPAVVRQECLGTLIQHEMDSQHIVLWRLGFLLHAYGDAFAHSYPDENRFILDPNRCPKQKELVPNPNYKKRYLYRAPLGHALQGEVPDQVRSDFTLFDSYFIGVVQLLNRNPLSEAQSESVRMYLDTVHMQLLKNKGSEDEIFRGRIPAGPSGSFGEKYDPAYDPDSCTWAGPYCRKQFEQLLVSHPLSYNVELPTGSQVDDLIREIQSGCSESHAARNSN